MNAMLFTLCGLMLGELYLARRRLVKIIENDLTHIKQSLDDLPCRRKPNELPDRTDC